MNPSLHVYDCANDPLNFEFVPWLVRAEMIRRQHGGEPPLRITFMRERQAEQRRPGWVDQVMRPLLPMIGAREDARLLDFHEFLESPPPWNQPFQSVEHIEADIVARHARGETVPLLRAEPASAFFEPGGILGALGVENAPTGFPWGLSPVIVTLREAAHWPHRNSNVPEWLRFAQELQHQGERVIFLRGHEKADERLDGFEICPMASRSLALRMGFHRYAKMNFFVSDGPAMLCFFSNAPYVAFMTHYAGHQGPQRPWATERQRTVYARDTHEAIQGAWEAAKRTSGLASPVAAS